MSCNKCGSFNKCGCTAVPYYQQTDVCVEDHCLKVYQPQFNFSVCPTSSWNVPQCGQTAILSVPGLLGATVGSYLWHPQFGYYKIISVDAVNGLLGIVNTCVEGNASAGAQVPACTCFVVTDPPVETNLSGVCVALDFVAPAEDVPLDILLTGTTGLTVGDIVQIGTGFYFLSAIKPDNIVTIINKGEGITPGTPVVAFDAEGNPLLCLSTISENPCDREAIDEIKLLGCDGDGLIVPLNVDNEDWVVTGLDPVDNTVVLRPIGATGDDCTTLVGVFNLSAGVANYANIAVTTSAPFVVGDILEIQGGGSFRFEVTNIPNATHIDVTVSPVPAAPASFADGSVVCIQSCCETFFDILPTLQVLGVFAQNVGGDTIQSGDPTFDSTVVDIVIDNTAGGVDMSLTVQAHAILPWLVGGGNTNSFNITFDFFYGVNTPGVAATNFATMSPFYWYSDDGDQTDAHQLYGALPLPASVPAGTSITLSFKVRASYVGVAGPVVTIANTLMTVTIQGAPA